MSLIIKNGQILQNNGIFCSGHIFIDNGIISNLFFGDAPSVSKIARFCGDAQIINAQQHFVSPGFIDTHIHGGMGFDFSYSSHLKECHVSSLDDANQRFGTQMKQRVGSDDYEIGWEKMQERLIANGVTSILATLFSLPPDETLFRIDRIVDLAKKNQTNKVDIEGIHVEGPFFNKNKKGIHREEFIRKGSLEEVKNILDHGSGQIKILTLAPDTDENMALINFLTTEGISVSIAHTEADYNTAMTAFSSGANRVTHTFNTIPVIDHRYEGIITAAWQYGAFMELIADGQHVSPTILNSPENPTENIP